MSCYLLKSSREGYYNRGKMKDEIIVSNIILWYLILMNRMLILEDRDVNLLIIVFCKIIDWQLEELNDSFGE